MYLPGKAQDMGCLWKGKKKGHLGFRQGPGILSFCNSSLVGREPMGKMFLIGGLSSFQEMAAPLTHHSKALPRFQQDWTVSAGAGLQLGSESFIQVCYLGVGSQASELFHIAFSDVLTAPQVEPTGTQAGTQWDAGFPADSLFTHYTMALAQNLNF